MHFSFASFLLGGEFLCENSPPPMKNLITQKEIKVITLG